MKNGIHSALLAGAALLTVPTAAHADEQQDGAQSVPGTWRISTGVNYSQGDYGDVQDTRVISAPLAVKYKRGGFSLRLSAPYVHIDGPGSLLDTPQGRDAGFGDSGSLDDNGGSSGSSGNSDSGSSSSGSGAVSGTPTAASNRRSGIGDIAVVLGYSLTLGETTYFDLSGRMKLPTASTAKRLGTGKVDVTLGGDLVQDIGRATVYAGGRRKFIGKPVGSALRDTWALGGGASYRLPGGTVIGADYDWQQASSAGNGPSSEVTGWINFGLTRKLRMQLFAATGLTARSTDFAGGLSLSYRLN